MTSSTKNRLQSASLRTCKKVLRQAIYAYQKLTKKCSPQLLDIFDLSIDSLHNAIEKNDLFQARESAQEISQFLQEHNKTNFWGHLKEFLTAIIIALAIAGVVRQMWFELYEIPSGSMRPTFKEKDGVFSLKNTFGINVPFETRHFSFDPELLQRGNIVIITGDGLGFSDVDTTYFGLFPGKRRYVKRCVAKGGDTIYFYGGKIYGIDAEGHPIEEVIDIEHIPFIHFEGKVEQGINSSERLERTLFLRHMNIPIAKMSFTPSGVSGQISTPDGWKRETLSPGSFPQAFFEFWGIGNFAISKLITPEELPKEAVSYQDNNAQLYLELIHTPTLPTKQQTKGDFLSLLHTRKTWIPLASEQCDRLSKALYTARFFVQRGKAYPYAEEGPKGKGIVIGQEVPNGCYEFFDGIAYEIGLGAISHKLESTHPIYPKTAKALKVLYNSGIEFYFLPRDSYPARYTYFRQGDLVTLNQPVFHKDDPLLEKFNNQERQRQLHSPDYIAFSDRGPPLDAAFINAFGLKIPEGHYLLLGDNHAMSNDSRFIGAVPQNNIQGSPKLIFWPPGDRWGSLDQPSQPFSRMPNVIILSSVTVIALFSLWVHRNNRTYTRFTALRKKRVSK